MEAHGAPSEVLLQRPWLSVSISGCQLLAKSWFGETAYHILLTDTHCVWEESMDSAAIQKRAQVCQQEGGDAPPHGEAQLSVLRQDGDISVKLKSELAGLPFYWEFQCTPAPVTVVCVQLLRPLLAMSHLLQRQVEQLAGLLVRKDAEIQDYRENGATLSRERLQTEVFVEETYREDFIAKALPQLCAEQQDALIFDPDLQCLYATVVAHRNAQSKKRRLSEEDEPPAGEPDPAPASSAGEPVPETGGATPHGRDNQEEAGRAKMADRPATQQPGAVTSNPAERPSSKPKKKKGKGLFR